MENILQKKTYLIQNLSTGYYKIGIGQNPNRRVKQLQTGSSGQLKIIFVLDKNVQKQLHQMFKHIRIRPNSQWFYNSVVILNHFQNLYNQQQELKNNKTCIVVLSNNNWEISRQFLQFYDKYTNHNLSKLLWIDNGSQDSTLDNLNKIKTKYFRLISNKQNIGCINGRNLGANIFIKEYTDCNNLIFLDNDQIVGKDWIYQYINFAKDYDMCGVQAWKMNEKYFPIEKCKNKDEIFNYVGCGGSFLKRKVIQKIGMYDQTFNPSYFEDPDYCVRSNNNNFSIGWNHNANIIHLQKNNFNTNKIKQERFKISYNKFVIKMSGKPMPELHNK